VVHKSNCQSKRVSYHTHTRDNIYRMRSLPPNPFQFTHQSPVRISHLSMSITCPAIFSFLDLIILIIGLLDVQIWKFLIKHFLLFVLLFIVLFFARFTPLNPFWSYTNCSDHRSRALPKSAFSECRTLVGSLQSDIRWAWCLHLSWYSLMSSLISLTSHKFLTSSFRYLWRLLLSASIWISFVLFQFPVYRWF
jgi:hypothetical protein